MRVPDAIDAGGRPATSIHIGGVFASAEPSVVRTVLGSCIAVCLRDPIAEVGGMNHFMLPDGAGSSSASYGVHAMELLINQCMKLGADRRRLVAKVFGGGHVLRIRESDGNVPKANVRFAREFLRTEGIEVVSHDVGGYAAREVYFFTDSGRTVLRRLPPTGLDSNLVKALAPAPAAACQSDDDDNVTLF